MLVPLAAQLVNLLHASAAHADGPVVRIDDLLYALCAQTNFGEALQPTLRAPENWGTAPSLPAQSELGFWTARAVAYFDHDALEMLLAGTTHVILGPYQPRHLAAAIGNAAAIRPARFARFGFSAQAWLRALAMKSEDH